MKGYLKNRLSVRQYQLLRALSYEWKRWKCRVFSPKKFKTEKTHFHLGCGDRHIDGWLNVDLFESDLNLDIANGKLPLESGHFRAIVSQHVVEHLFIEDELIPLLKECFRILELGGELWLATPDMEKSIRSYIDHLNLDMIEDRQKRLPHWSLHQYPHQHFMNDLFYQDGEHKNLFDYGLLEWTLRQSGFSIVDRVSETEMLRRFPAFPPRRDDYQSLYVRAVK